MVGRIIFGCLLFSMSALAQEQDSIHSGNQQQTAKKSWMEKFQQVQCYLDSTARLKVDQRYIEVPDKPWRVVLRYKETAFDAYYNNSIVSVRGNGIDWKMSFEPPVAASVGFWVGYRGTGVSFAKSLNKKAGTYLSFSTTGAKYGFNLRLRGLETYETKLNATIHADDYTENIEQVGNLDAPVRIASLYLNGYYVFSGRRYSQAAAYNQSVIQRHSAGSFLLGATCYLSSFDFAKKKNLPMIYLSQGVGRILIHQANLGIGYGYNFVPLRGLVINAMAMPTVSVYNKVKVNLYDYNYTFASGDGIDDYGEWNPETKTWANGKKQKPVPDDDDEDKWLETADIWKVGSEKEYSPLRFNLDLRLGVAYNWKRYFVGLQMQLNGFSYKKDFTKVDIIDAYARASLGVRL